MHSTLTIRGVKYTVSPDQKEQIEQIDKEMRDEIMSMPNDVYDGSTIGNVPDRFKPIVENTSSG